MTEGLTGELCSPISPIVSIADTSLVRGREKNIKLLTTKQSTGLFLPNLLLAQACQIWNMGTRQVVRLGG